MIQQRQNYSVAMNGDFQKMIIENWKFQNLCHGYWSCSSSDANWDKWLTK
jgi:hypothetical protein